MSEEYCLTVMNPTTWNEFEHRQVVFTRIKRAGNGKDKPISQVLQIWDVATDTLVVELTLKDSL